MNKYFNNKNGDWLLFTKSFLNIAELAAREVRVRNGRKYFDSKKLVYNEELFIAIIFNIKHSMEIFLKTLNVTLKWDELKKDGRGHDLFNLFKNLKEVFKQTKPTDIKLVIEKAYKKYSNNNYLILANKDIKMIKNNDSLDDYFNELEKLINKYQKCKFIKQNIGKIINLNDSKNDGFRYPQNSLGLRINYNELINNVNIDDGGDMDDILKDIKDLKKLYVIEFLLFVYNEYKNEFLIKKSKK